MQSCIKLCIKTTKGSREIQNSKFKIQNYEEQVLVSSSRLGIAQVNLLSALAPQRRFKITRRNTRFLLAMINFLLLQMDD
jgi:hypothetical protein